MTCKKKFAGHLILIELQATQKLLVCYSMYLNIKSRMCSLNSNWIIPKLPVTSFSTPSKWGILTATQGFISQRDELPNFFLPMPLPTKDDNHLQIVFTIPCQHSETKENQTIKLKVLLGSWPSLNTQSFIRRPFCSTFRFENLSISPKKKSFLCFRGPKNEK